MTEILRHGGSSLKPPEEAKWARKKKGKNLRHTMATYFWAGVHEASADCTAYCANAAPTPAGKATERVTNLGISFPSPLA